VTAAAAAQAAPLLLSAAAVHRAPHVREFALLAAAVLCGAAPPAALVPYVGIFSASCW
jgi:hypothetical protein